MEQRLFLVLLCLATSIAGGRSRVIPDGSPAPEPAAAELVPNVSPTQEPTANRGTPKVSPTSQPAAARMAPGNAPTPRGPAASPSLSPLRSKGFSLENIGAVLSNAPDQSEAAEEAASLVQQVDVPSAKEMAGGINVSAALSSVDDKTLKTLSSYI